MGKSHKKMIRLSKSCIGEAEKQAIMRVLDREYLGMGTEVQQFEEQLTQFFGRPSVCVSNGTAALHLSLQACEIGTGDEVLVQSLTYVASFQAISATGAKPVSCDIDPETLCLDWQDAEKRLTNNTKAVMPVHYSGGVGALDDIYSFAKKYDLRVIEDAAHAFGTEYNRKRVGSFGDIACFSFDGIKNITSGEGGCITSNDESTLQKIRDSRLLGVEKDTGKRYSGNRSWNFDVKTNGWRYHMSNIMAAIGIEQLKQLNIFANKRRILARKYDYLLSDVKGVEILKHNYEQVVPHIYVVKFSRDVCRDRVMKCLTDNQIQTGVHYLPNHMLSFYQSDPNRLKNVNLLYSRVLSLPLHPDLSEHDVIYVCEILIGCINDE
jgi:dTDP-4-amino-4,6-dideoxygalactose transaminase